MASVKINYLADIWVKNSEDNYAYIPWGSLKKISLNKWEAIIYHNGGTEKFEKDDEAYDTIKRYAVGFEDCKSLFDE